MATKESLELEFATMADNLATRLNGNAENKQIVVQHLSYEETKVPKFTPKTEVLYVLKDGFKHKYRTGLSAEEEKVLGQALGLDLSAVIPNIVYDHVLSMRLSFGRNIFDISNPLDYLKVMLLINNRYAAISQDQVDHAIDHQKWYIYSNDKKVLRGAKLLEVISSATAKWKELDNYEKSQHLLIFEKKFFGHIKIFEILKDNELNDKFNTALKSPDQIGFLNDLLHQPREDVMIQAAILKGMASKVIVYLPHPDGSKNFKHNGMWVGRDVESMFSYFKKDAMALETLVKDLERESL